MLVRLRTSLALGLPVIATLLWIPLPGSALAHSNDWATPFMGGIMAGRVLSKIGEQRQQQTEAMQEMARGGGYGEYRSGNGGGDGGYRSGGYGGYRGDGYGGGYAPSYAPPSPEQQLQQLNQLAVGGYITPQQYQERRQAILNGM